MDKHGYDFDKDEGPKIREAAEEYGCNGASTTTAASALLAVASVAAAVFLL
jgi:hypothetical protein